MEAGNLQVAEKVPASRKLGREDATALAKQASRVVIAKGKKVTDVRPRGKVTREIIDGMLGSTGNLRAPLLRVGKTLLVGFNEDVYQEVLG